MIIKYRYIRLVENVLALLAIPAMFFIFFTRAKILTIISYCVVYGIGIYCILMNLLDHFKLIQITYTEKERRRLNRRLNNSVFGEMSGYKSNSIDEIEEKKKDQ